MKLFIVNHAATKSKMRKNHVQKIVIANYYKHEKYHDLKKIHLSNYSLNAIMDVSAQINIIRLYLILNNVIKSLPAAYKNVENLLSKI